MVKWYRYPGPGQFRGEGEWVKVVGAEAEKNWQYYKDTGFLPTHEGDTHPEEEASK